MRDVPIMPAPFLSNGELFPKMPSNKNASKGKLGIRIMVVVLLIINISFRWHLLRL